MYSKLLRICSLFLFFMMTSSLQAGGWGKTNEITQYENAKWNNIYFDMNGVNFTALIPNFSGAALQNGDVSFNGNHKDTGYLISTSFNSAFNPPNSVQDFIESVQKANANYIVTELDPTRSGSKFAVELTPKKEKGTYWRFFCTHNRLIQMGTSDANKNRRLYFFESLIVR